MTDNKNDLTYKKDAADGYAKFGDKEFKGDLALSNTLSCIDLANKDILDYGCGNGRMEKKFLSYNPRSIVGMEISEPMLEEANKLVESFSPENQKRVKFKKIEAGQLPFEANTFDIVIVHFVLHYIPHLEPVMNELYRVLRPGGRIITTLNDFSLAQGFEHLTETTLPLVIGKTIKVDVLIRSQQAYIDSLKDAGFIPEKIERFDNSSAYVDPTYKNIDQITFENTAIVAQRVFV